MLCFPYYITLLDSHKLKKSSLNGSTMTTSSSLFFSLSVQHDEPSWFLDVTNSLSVDQYKQYGLRLLWHSVIMIRRKAVQSLSFFFLFLLPLQQVYTQCHVNTLFSLFVCAFTCHYTHFLLSTITDSNIRWATLCCLVCKEE